MKIRVTIWNSDRREILTVGTFLHDNMTRKTIKTPNKSYLRSSHKYQRVRPFQNILNSTINHKVIFPRRHLRLNDHQPILHWSNVILEVLNFMLLLNPPIRRGLGDLKDTTLDLWCRETASSDPAATFDHFFVILKYFSGLKDTNVQQNKRHGHKRVPASHLTPVGRDELAQDTEGD